MANAPQDVQTNIPAEAGYARQIISGLMDAALSIALVLGSFLHQFPPWLYDAVQSLNSSLVALLALVVYRLLFLLLFQRTVGMWLTGIRLLNGYGKPLGFWERMLAAVFVLYKGADYYNR